MNNKFKELLEKADMGYLFAKDEMRPGMVNPDSLLKFAELFVKECAELAKHHVMNISTYADAEFVDQQIKEHFGVAE